MKDEWNTILFIFVLSGATWFFVYSLGMMRVK
jgi:hypothetical protein